MEHLISQPSATVSSQNDTAVIEVIVIVQIFFKLFSSLFFIKKTLICELGVFTRVCTPLYMYDMYVRWCTHVYVL